MDGLVRKGNWLPLTALIAVSALLYSPSWHYPYVFDDESFIVHNQTVHQIHPVSFYFSNSLMNSGGQAKNAGIYFRPVVSLLYSILWWAGDGSTFPFHFFQWLLHTLSAFYLFKLLSVIARPIVALIWAAFFLVHPINTEGVVYISDLCDVLFFNLGLLALWLAVSLPWKILAALAGNFFLLVALFAKETAALFLPLLMALQFRKNKAGAAAAGAVVTLGLYLWARLTLANLSTLAHNQAPIALVDLETRLLNIPKIVSTYLAWFLWPMSLTLQGDWVVQAATWWSFYLPLLVCLLFAAALAAFYWRYRQGLVVLLILTLLGNLLLHSQIIPLGATITHRWFIVSFAALVGLLTIASEDWMKTRPAALRPFGAVMLVILVGLSALAFQRTQEWSSPLALYTVDVQRQPDSYLAQNNLGVELYRAGRRNEARPHFEKSLELRPDWGTSANNLGAMFERDGNFQRAEELYHFAAMKNYYLGLENYAKILYRQKKWPELSRFLAEIAIPNYPNNPLFIELRSALPAEHQR